MVTPEFTHSYSSPMAKSSARNKTSLCLTDTCLFLGGAFLALLLVWSLWSVVAPAPHSSANFESVDTASAASVTRPTTTASSTSGFRNGASVSDCRGPGPGPNLRDDPPQRTFYDDPKLSYTMDEPVKNWDEKRREWLRLHPSFAHGAENRIFMVTGSQPNPCKNPIGDHLLLRFFKNKVDYCRIHGYDIFYNDALLNPKMFAYWAKYPVVRASMLAHPEAEWIWWVDSDALFTDMEFKLPLERYKDHNLVVHGWAHLVYDQKSWTGLNAGVFLIRNCQWSFDFMDLWASLGPQTPQYEKWGQTLRSEFKDKTFSESDDQTGLAYLIVHGKKEWTDKIYLEAEYYFEGYWEEIVGTYANISAKYMDIEHGVRRLRRRHAEKVSESYGEVRDAYLKDAGNGRGSWRRPFITHFTGCQPCSGKHNEMYSGQSCWDGMQRALSFADNQVLRKYGFVHPDLHDHSVSPVPFDYPAV